MRIVVGIVLLIISVGISGAINFINPQSYSLYVFLFMASLSYYSSDTLENSLIVATAFGLVLDMLLNNRLFFLTAGLPIFLFAAAVLKDYFKAPDNRLALVISVAYALFLVLYIKASLLFSVFVAVLAYLFYLFLSTSTRLILLKGRNVKER